MRTPFSKGLVFCFAVAALSTQGAFGQNGVQEMAKKSRKGVAFLKGYANGKSITGTGFLVDSRIVITNAHVVEGANTIFAEFDGGEKIDCSLVDSNSRLDLAALSLDKPLENRALSAHKGVEVVQGEKIFIIGHPLGLKWSVHQGTVAAIRTLGEIAEALGVSAPSNPDQMAIQLNIDSTAGMSGAPVLNSDGDVIGIQKEGWKDGLTGINFCIPQESLDQLNLRKQPRRFPGGVTLGDDFRTVGLQKQSLVQPELRVDDRVVDIGCQHWGFVPRNVDFVFNKYIGDKARFAFTMPKNVVQEILNRHRVVHVTNSAFGISFLTPENYELSQSPQSGPALQITLTSRDAGVPATFRTLGIHASRMSASKEASALSTRVKNLAESFAMDKLHLNVHDPYSPIPPAARENDVAMFLALSDQSPRIEPALGLARYHVTYVSPPVYNKAWNIYAAIAGETATITAYQYMTQSRIPRVNPDAAERQFIAETVSFDMLNRTSP